MQLPNELVVSKQCTLKADGDSTESKTFTIKLVMPSGTTARDMATSILASYVIKWQNANRKRWASLRDRDTITLTYQKPITSIDPTEQLLADARASGVDTSDKSALAEYIMARITKQ